MDHKKSFTRHPHLSPTRPLYLHKQSSQVHATRSQPQLNNNNANTAQSNVPTFPPRTSSMRNSDASGKSYSREAVEALAFPAETALSTLSRHGKKHRSGTSSNGNSSIASTLSTVSSIKTYDLSDSSSAMMGDFIPISAADLKTAQPPKKGFVVMDSMLPDAQSVIMSGIAASNA